MTVYIWHAKPPASRLLRLKALLWLESGEPKPMRSIAESLKCDASWVTGIVDGLETRGYAERKAHPGDRRIKVVVITSLGKKAKARALECLYEPPASFSALSLSEQRQLRDLLAKIMTRTRSSSPT